jgi:hypothetical protein
VTVASQVSVSGNPSIKLEIVTCASTSGISQNDFYHIISAAKADREIQAL